LCRIARVPRALLNGVSARRLKSALFAGIICLCQMPSRKRA
jgi:hypothetical protein